MYSGNLDFTTEQAPEALLNARDVDRWVTFLLNRSRSRRLSAERNLNELLLEGLHVLHLTTKRMIAVEQAQLTQKKLNKDRNRRNEVKMGLRGRSRLSRIKGRLMTGEEFINWEADDWKDRQQRGWHESTPTKQIGWIVVGETASAYTRIIDDTWVQKSECTLIYLLVYRLGRLFVTITSFKTYKIQPFEITASRSTVDSANLGAEFHAQTVLVVADSSVSWLAWREHKEILSLKFVTHKHTALICEPYSLLGSSRPTMKLPTDNRGGQVLTGNF